MKGKSFNRSVIGYTGNATWHNPPKNLTCCFNRSVIGYTGNAAGAQFCFEQVGFQSLGDWLYW